MVQWSSRPIALALCVTHAGCDAREPRDASATPPDDVSDDEVEQALADYCEETGECADGKADATTAIIATAVLWKGLTKLAKAAISFSWIEDNWCVAPDRFEHFVDYAAFVDGTPYFTSVQDFEIRRTDIEPEDVLVQFHDDWLRWWENGGSNDRTTGTEGPGVWHQEIKPLGLPMVNIVMDVGDIEDVEHPELRNPERDESGGYEKRWDAGLVIDMSPGNAFDGTMYVLARKTDTGIAVREIWHDTEPLSALVMKVVPVLFDLDEEQTLAIPPALHILATEGCVPVTPNTGYPGLIEKFESGEWPK